MTLTHLLKQATLPLNAMKTVGRNRLNLTLFCDFDGPRVDVSKRYYGTYKTALRHTQATYLENDQQLPLKPLAKEQFWHMKRQRVSDIEIAMQSGLQEEETAFFLDYVREIVNKSELLHLDVMQQSVNWSLGLLHSYGVKLVLVTLREESQVHRMLDQYGLKRLFSGIYGSHARHTAYQNNIDVKTSLLKEAISEQGELKDHWVMVGDTEADIVAAQRMNIPVIALTCGIRDAEYLKKYSPDYLTQDLLSTAHLLIKRYGKSDRYAAGQADYFLSNALT